MGKVYSHLDERLRKFIARQPMFFVATAPRETAAGDGGHVNVSPKGYRDTFAVLSPLAVAYGARCTVFLERYARCQPPRPAGNHRGGSGPHRRLVKGEGEVGGYAVPRMELIEERGLLEELAERKSPEELTAYHAEKNAVSIDGLPALADPPAIP